MLSVFFTTISVFGVLYLLQKLIARYRWSRHIEQLPGPKAYPIIGSAMEFTFKRNQRLLWTKKWNAQYGKIFRFWIGPNAVVTTSSPEYVETILTSTVNISKAKGYEFFEPWLGTGLLLATGAKWRTRRKMLTPAFHFSVLKTYFDIFVENAKILVSKLENEIESKEFDIFPYINNCTLDIICETAMGVKINAQSNTSAYINSVKDINELLIYRIMRPWLWPNIIYFFSKNYNKEKETLDILHTMSYNVIQQRREERNEERINSMTNIEDSNIGEKKKTAFLDLLLDISEKSTESFTDADIREEVDTFMFEGHDTTSAGIMWALFCIGTYQDIQEKIVEELNSVFGSSNHVPTLSDISELKYLECVIKEALRLFPAVPFIGRTLDEDIYLGEYFIPKGVLVEVNFYMLHRNPEHFIEPEKFDPSRFSSENIRDRHPFAFVPFSAGLRNCIGQKFAMLEEKVILSSILRKYKITAVDKYEELSIIPESILRSEHGLRVKISDRV